MRNTEPTRGHRRSIGFNSWIGMHGTGKYEERMEESIDRRRKKEEEHGI